jgi:uncharacterized protein YjiS (DUF1127 family)
MIMKTMSLVATQAPSRFALGSRICHAIGSWWLGYLGWRRRRASVRLLQSLSDRTLHDIGINRSEIESVVHSATDNRRQRRNFPERWAGR